MHPIEELLRECIYAIAQGSREAAGDANDLDTLKRDPALLLSSGKPLEEALASQPTLSRLENGVDRKDLLCLAFALAEVVIGQ